MESKCKEGAAATSPPNFSWLEAGILAGSGIPCKISHCEYLKRQKVSVLVSLTEDALLPEINKDFLYHHISVKDFTAPSIEQMMHFVKLVEQSKSTGKAVLVHCLRGRGRTGTMLAAYLIWSQSLPSEEAIGVVRRMRPHSIETLEQEQALCDFHGHVLRHTTTKT